MNIIYLNNNRYKFTEICEIITNVHSRFLQTIQNATNGVTIYNCSIIDTVDIQMYNFLNFIRTYLFLIGYEKKSVRIITQMLKIILFILLVPIKIILMYVLSFCMSLTIVFLPILFYPIFFAIIMMLLIYFMFVNMICFIKKYIA